MVDFNLADFHIVPYAFLLKFVDHLTTGEVVPMNGVLGLSRDQDHPVPSVLVPKEPVASSGVVVDYLVYQVEGVLVDLAVLDEYTLSTVFHSIQSNLNLINKPR